MSSMWNITVINKGQKWVDLEVVLAHPDAGSFPEDPVFALSLITSEAYRFDDNYNRIPDSPIGEMINFNDSYELSSLESRLDEFVEKTVIYEAKNIPFDEQDAHERIDELVYDAGVERDDENWDEAWDGFWRDFWDNKDNLPWAKYRTWVTDEKWIEHLKIGQKFDSASYSDNGPWLDEDRNIELPEESDGAARKALEGFKDSEIPAGENTMDTAMIRRMAENSDEIQREELLEMIAEHVKFLESGGEGGEFMRLEVAGMPMNIYRGSGSEGTQLELRMKKIAPGTDLSGMNLSYADLSGVLCENVNFAGANLDGAILTDGFFSNANFEGASIKNVDFTGADLSHASFKHADVERGDFEIANCSHADFTETWMYGASFKGANLDNVKR